MVMVGLAYATAKLIAVKGRVGQVRSITNQGSDTVTVLRIYYGRKHTRQQQQADLLYKNLMKAGRIGF